jgi:uncharacterized membrane protein
MTSADVLPLDRHRPDSPRSGRALLLAGGVIGIALGGLFDGILLHQILQWHHFLSLVPGEALRDIKNQIIADGVFHVLMYVIAAVGLWMLWRARGDLVGGGSGRRLLASVLLGFGIWQVIDVVVFHWIARIHRIRVDVAEPLPWDIGWMLVFGAPALLAGWLILRRIGDGPSAPGRGRGAAVGLAALVLVAGPVAARPPTDSAAAMVLFRAGTGSAQALNAVAAIEGRVLWADPSGELVAFAPAPGRSTLNLYRYGALAVGAMPVVAGCLAWIKA